MKTALSIAGSDSSGGAGIQADIKTMTMNGVFAMTAVTALTAQNTTGVTGILEVDPPFLAQQLDAVFSDIRPDAVKIGMVSSAAITGAQHNFDEAKQQYFRRIDAMHLRNPRMIGFGISNRQTLKAAQDNAAGAIIGSKFVTLLDEADGDADLALDRLLQALNQ